MIIVSDAHINKSRGNHSEFFKMLAAIEKTEHDLIFLGDIFDLWIALPRYEEDIHVNFIAWSREQKDSRTIGFLEGNHEFYVGIDKSLDFYKKSNFLVLRNESYQTGPFNIVGLDEESLQPPVDHEIRP